MRFAESSLFIPPEMCAMSGIPDEIRQDPRALRDIMASSRTTPEQKMRSLDKFAG